MYAALLSAWVLTASATPAGTTLEFRFDRLWPALQQPWYFNAPRGIAEDEFGNVYVADDLNNKVRKFTRDGTLISQWGVQGDGPTELSGPKGLVIGPDGNLWVTDDEFVRVFDRDGTFIRRFGGIGNTCPGKFTVVADIAFDAQNNVYVTDSNNNRVQKVADLGQCLSGFPGYDDQPESMPCAIPDPDLSGCVTIWGGPGTGAGQFDSPRGIGVNSLAEVFVADHNNSRVQKFASDGSFLLQWGGQGPADGQFEFPDGLAVDGDDQVVVADFSNNRIQVFDGAGNHQNTIDGPEFQSADDFYFPVALSVLDSGEMYVTDLPEYRVLRFDAAGNLTANWSSGSTLQGRFSEPGGIDIGPGPMGGDRLYVADTANHRIQVFFPDGRLDYSFGTFTQQGGAFDSPDALAIGNGVLYVYNAFGQVDRFTLDGNGTLLGSWPDPGNADPDPFLPNCQGRFDSVRGIAVDGGGNVYVSDHHEGGGIDSRVLKFDAAGNCLQEIGDTGRGAGMLDEPAGIAVDSRGWLYVADVGAIQVAVYDDSGQFQFVFGEECDVVDPPCLPGQLDFPYGLAIQGSQVFVSDGIAAFTTELFPGRIHLFDTVSGAFLARFAPPGVGPGQVVEAKDMVVDSLGQVFVSDSLTNRVQKFVTTALADNTKAIVVAGGGPFPGNVLWPATQSNASFAYRALNLQGFSRDTIYYLSADTDLDLDQNGLPDDVDADATNEGLQEAILGPSGDGLTGFAADAENLVIYLVDHGGQDSFRMSGTQILDSATLGQWIDTWQLNHPGSGVVIVYDACQSGSFLEELSSAALDRVVVTSSQGDENAYFVSQGTLSFSNFFWTGIFNGQSLGNAFESAAQSTTDAFPSQHPLLDADGDGAFGGTAEVDLVRTRFVGAGNDQFGEAPVIGGFSITPGGNENTATLTATGVTDADGIARVWTVIRPPGFNPGSPDNPVNDLPTADLVPTGTPDEYQVDYTAFSEPGTYNLTLYALDTLGNTAMPMNQQLAVGNPLARRAVILVGGDPADASYGALAAGADRAYRALDEQGYGVETCPPITFGLCDATTCDNVCYLTASGGLGFDAAPDLANLQQAITQWGVDPNGDLMADVQDLTLYLAVQSNGAGGYRLTANPADDLDVPTLVGWLNTVQAMLPGTLTVIVEGDEAGSFISAVSSGTPGLQILVGSAGPGEQAVLLQGGEVSFSKFFWTQVLNGATVRNAFALARQAISFSQDSPIPQLEDDGDGMPNGLLDGLRAATYTIGSGILLAGDDPLVGAVTVSDPLLSDFEVISVSNVTTTGQIDRVIAVVTRPDGTTVEQVLTRRGPLYSDPSFGLCGPAGDYQIAAFAIDGDGNVSLPTTTVANRPAGCSDFLFFNGFE